MKFPIKTTVALVVIVGGGAAAFPHAKAYWAARNKPHFREAEVRSGDIISVVNATGTVQPVLRVSVGSFVSGPVVELNVKHNEEVKKGQLMARIDPRMYKASFARDEATLTTRKAEVARATALLGQAVKNEERAVALREMNADYLSDTEMDQITCNCATLRAQLQVAEAAVLQAEAGLETSRLQLSYTEITSPVDGVVIDRKIDEGQTLAAQFQTPELFVVAPDMRERMHIFAAVNEAEIGLIREAQERKEKVHFTVDAYPEELLDGWIYQVRFSSMATQGVVTYPVLVETTNPDLKLLPGMTANLSFQIEEHKDVLKIPNAALRFYPRPEQVREEDRKLLDGTSEDPNVDEDKEDDEESGQRSASEIATANQRRSRRHVWVVEGDKLRAVEVVIGLVDFRWSELVSGELKKGQKLVTRVGPPK